MCRCIKPPFHRAWVINNLQRPVKDEVHYFVVILLHCDVIPNGRERFIKNGQEHVDDDERYCNDEQKQKDLCKPSVHFGHLVNVELSHHHHDTWARKKKSGYHEDLETEI